eukprot:COSAG01_NODE_33091_length_570_cov_1.082803_1_plen_118_part_10
MLSVGTAGEVKWKKANVMEITADRERSWRVAGAHQVDVDAAMAAEDARVAEALYMQESDTTLDAAIHNMHEQQQMASTCDAAEDRMGAEEAAQVPLPVLKQCCASCIADFVLCVNAAG